MRLTLVSADQSLGNLGETHSCKRIHEFDCNWRVKASLLKLCLICFNTMVLSVHILPFYRENVSLRHCVSLTDLPGTYVLSESFQLWSRSSACWTNPSDREGTIWTKRRCVYLPSWNTDQGVDCQHKVSQAFTSHEGKLRKSSLEFERTSAFRETQSESNVFSHTHTCIRCGPTMTGFSRPVCSRAQTYCPLD